MASVTSERSKTPTPRRTVVIVEAPGFTASIRLRQIAVGAGFRVISATSGPMLLSYARKSAPDLILLAAETGPPGPSEIARGLKEDPATRDIPVCQLLHDQGAFFQEAAGRAYPTEAILPEVAPDEEILRTMRMLTARPSRVRYEKREAAPLEGDLESDSFPEVLQYLFATGKTGRISVRDGTKRGVICLEEGLVVHAEMGDLTGLAAFRGMCFSQQGWFQFEPGSPGPQRTMRGDGIGLLLEAARRKDTAGRVSSRAARPSRLVARELFAEPADRGPSPKSLLAIALLLGALLLAGFGVYALTLT